MGKKRYGFRCTFCQSYHRFKTRSKNECRTQGACIKLSHTNGVQRGYDAPQPVQQPEPEQEILVHVGEEIRLATSEERKQIRQSSGSLRAMMALSAAYGPRICL